MYIKQAHTHLHIHIRIYGWHDSKCRGARTKVVKRVVAARSGSGAKRVVEAQKSSSRAKAFKARKRRRGKVVAVGKGKGIGSEAVTKNAAALSRRGALLFKTPPHAYAYAAAGAIGKH